MDGTVQVFAKAGSQGDEWTQWEGEDMNGYQLLNEVGTGSTLSSLFTILSLFTEDVQIAWQESKPDLSRSTTSLQRDDGDVPQFDLSGAASFELVPAQRPRPQRAVSISSEGSTIHPIVTEPEDVSPPWDDGGAVSRPDTPVAPRSPRTPAHSMTQLNHGTIARATVDSTLAVIPAEAFRRLTKKFPKASGHIVQGKPTSRCPT